MSKTTLEINLNEEYKIKIEKGNEFNNSIFKDVYTSALNNVIEIAKQSDNDIESKYDDFNNIIAFTGERGKGKSSSMISFRDALVNKDQPDHKSFFNDSSYKYLFNKSFAEIDVIDPSLFRGGESLFEIILAKMFQRFQTEINKAKCEIHQDDKRSIIHNFQKVFENLQIINSDRKEIYKKETIEALSKLATSSNLRQCFKDLISVYLSKFDDNKDYLIIAIDDFDLNISGAYEMLEDIRQFFIQPKIILLIASKIEQLNDSIINNLAYEFKSLSSFYHQNVGYNMTNNLENNRYPRINQHINIENKSDLYDKFNIASHKYIEKLFPLHRRLNLPELYIDDKDLMIFIGNQDELSNLKIEDIVKNNLHLELKASLINNKVLFTGSDLSLLLSEFIYAKSGLFINIPKHRINNIFPHNLRGVLSLLSITKKTDINSEFLKYILDIGKMKLEKEFIEVFEVLENQPLESLNISIVNSIGRLKEKFNELNINYILFAKNPANVSIGDVYTVLYHLEKQIDYSNSKQILFLELLNIYYSLRLIDLEKVNNDLQSFYYSNSLSLFRTSNKRRKRDFISFEGLAIKKEFDKLNSINDKFWLANFFIIFGKYNERYRDDSYSPFFKNIQNVSNGVFSPLAIFTNILFPQNIIKQINLEASNELTLYYDVVAWNLNNKNLNNLFKNTMFLLEFLAIFDEESRTEHKSDGMNKSEEGDEYYFDVLFDYFTKSLERALKIFSTKYPFLDIDFKWWIENNPIIKHWKELLENKEKHSTLREIFQDIYLAQDPKNYSKEDVDISKKLLKEYSTYFKSDQSEKSRGAKLAMNSVYKAFDENSEIFYTLKELRDSMNTDLQGGLKEIEAFLKSIR